MVKAEYRGKQERELEVDGSYKTYRTNMHWRSVWLCDEVPREDVRTEYFMMSLREEYMTFEVLLRE